MKDQSCKPCAKGRYSLGTGIRFDEWDELPHGFATLANNLEIDEDFTETSENCTSSTWVPLGDYIASNTDECTATLIYAVNLKQSGTVSFEYLYPDTGIIFEFFVQNDQCQPNIEDSRWMKTTERGWEYHSVELNRGNNVLYWRTTAFSVWSKVRKPVLVRNIAITGTELGFSFKLPVEVFLASHPGPKLDPNCTLSPQELPILPNVSPANLVPTLPRRAPLPASFAQ
uniref:Endosome-lysosome associated apoptosis and autophagy regulator 1 n=1 Tax=Sarcophilus harrisii TaxID=9305 RepID=A0A7N4PN11_SARHA